MKCPFRTITRSQESLTVYGADETIVDFATCYGNECPYFGVIDKRYNTCTQRDEPIYGCRKCVINL